MDLNIYDDIMDKASCESIGEVIKKQNGKWSYSIRLNVLPTDDVFTTEGPEFTSAIEAAQAMFKVYGSDGWPK